MITVTAHPRIGRRTHQAVRAACLYVVLLFGAIVFLMPFLWMVSTSLKPQPEVYVFPPRWIPSELRFMNYVEGWTILPFWRFLRNTIVISVNNVIGNLVSCSLAAYAFARLRARGRDFLFVCMLATMMLSDQTTIIPSFILFRALGWIDTLNPLTVPAWFGAPFYIFLLRQFFMSLPRELDDAARIDGASIFGIFWQISLPLIRPALTAVAIFSFTSNWNAFFHPLIYLSSTKNLTLALGLRLFQGEYVSNFPQMMAVAILTMMPMLVVFFVGQKYFIQGIALTGIKG
jgi:ABC-type glycerol-3-phosphate transport system permease component